MSDIVERLRERLNLRYMSDCKCGKCQLVHGDDVAEAADEIERLREALNGAYTERNRCVALLATVYPSGLKSTDIPGWDKEWHNCVYIDFPTGQGSWHFHDDDAHLFNHVGPYAGEWDGHTTDEKYERIARAALGEGK